MELTYQENKLVKIRVADKVYYYLNEWRVHTLDFVTDEDINFINDLKFINTPLLLIKNKDIFESKVGFKVRYIKFD